MIIFAVYIVSIKGKILFSENFHSKDEIPNEVLLGGLVNALQGVAMEMSKGNSEMKTIEIEGLSYHFRSFGFYRVVLVTDVSKRPESVIQTVGLRFMKEFGEEIEEDQFDKLSSDRFRKILFEIIGKDFASDESKLIRPTKKFGTGEIFDLPHKLQSTALALLSLQEGTMDEIAIESGLNRDEIQENLFSLQELGYVGNRSKNGNILFFCSLD
jgi:hypothetical protein